jgi:hypothetical protein
MSKPKLKVDNSKIEKFDRRYRNLYRVDCGVTRIRSC